MKKFVSMAMVAAMTVSMVPATAFAASNVDATAKVAGSWTRKDSFRRVDDTTQNVIASKVIPELQIKITDDANLKTGADYKTTLTVTLDNADFTKNGTTVVGEGADLSALVGIRQHENTAPGAVTGTTSLYEFEKITDDTVFEGLLGKVYDAIANNENPATLDPALDENIYLYKVSDINNIGNNGVYQTTNWISMYDDGTGNINGDMSTWAIGALNAAGKLNIQNSTKAIGVNDVRAAVLEAYLESEKPEWASLVYAWNGGTSSWDCANGMASFAVTEANVVTWLQGVLADMEAGAEKTALQGAISNSNTLQSTTISTAGDRDAWIDDALTTLKNAANNAGTSFWAYRKTDKVSQTVVDGQGNSMTSRQFEIKAIATDTNELEITIDGAYLEEDDVIYVDLMSILDKAKDAHVSVESDDIRISNDSEDLLYVDIEDEGVKATVKKLADVAEEEKVYLEKNLKLESTVGDFADGQEIELKLSNGFEFAFVEEAAQAAYTLDKKDDDTVIVTVKGARKDFEIKAEHLQIEAASAKSGAVATIKVKAKNNVTGAFQATASVEVAKVIDYTVVMSVDKDADVPVIYSGVNVENDGITDDSDHLSLEVTIEESFPGAWSMRKGFNLELPDGVYVTNFELEDHDGLLINKKAATAAQITKAFEDAYKDGDHKNFEFSKRVFDDVNHDLEDDCATLSFQLELVADPTFVGDVNLKLTGDLVDEQEVTVAKFQPIAVVKAEQNDMKIDYRYTAIPTAITVTETEAGLWKEGSDLWVAIEKGDYIQFEDDATFETTGGLEIEDFTGTELDADGKEVAAVGFVVEDESDEAATVTVTDMELFMSRNIPAGPYDLIAGGSAFEGYHVQELFAPDKHADATDHILAYPVCKDECIVDDVCDYSNVVKEAFVNVVTAGREQDDASFTTKVVVPVGESYIVAGEHQVELDVPAYVSAAGYTMLPVRAVATALGINNNNVIWNGETKTVTILYGQRIITMAAGEKAVHVNGSVIPASAAVEIVDGRTFLPMRDLATALGVTDITWDAATKTATLNGNA